MSLTSGTTQSSHTIGPKIDFLCVFLGHAIGAGEPRTVYGDNMF